MGKRAVIYVRTSSEQQGEKCSPVEQEADCRQYADKQGLVVVNVYRDIERYRVKNKWVEPSGTRYDRPGLLSMLRDAADDQFDVILAWREDRLYRGMRAMLMVLETVQQHNLNIQLALESFDLATAPLKAWLAQVELDNIKERMTMGVKARLKAGKANSGQDRYGYKRIGERIEIVPEEAEWVRQIYAWYIEGVPASTMRRRLIAANAPQKDTTATRRIPWSISSIQGILASGDAYASGIKITRREGESFSLHADPILDKDTYQRYLEIRQSHVRLPTGIPRDGFLIRSLLYCPCQYKMQSSLSSSSRRAAIEGGMVSGDYSCRCQYDEIRSPDCPRRVNSRRADEDVWNQVCHVIKNPDVLIEQARAMVDELRSSAATQSADQERIEKELDALVSNRQWVITQARKGSITEQEMDRQLDEMSLQEVALKHELSSVREIIDTSVIENWEPHVRQYLADMLEGIAGLNTIPVDPQEEKENQALKRQIIQTLVEKVVVDRNQKFTVTIRLNLLQILEGVSGKDGGHGNDGHWPNENPNSYLSAPIKKSGSQTRMGLVRVSGIWQA
ncbi:MAG: recombinase family protein [Anaerolineales bacterium]|nr:MAG: recombinase family protein [Anaerolineales bacterium]